MMTKSDFVSQLVIKSLQSKLWNSSSNMKEPLILYSLVVRGSSIGTKNFTSFYVDVTMTDKRDLKDGRLSLAILWTLAETYIIPVFEPEALKSLYCSIEICFLSLRFLRTSVTLWGDLKFCHVLY